jgi:hypothetical protein
VWSIAVSFVIHNVHFRTDKTEGKFIKYTKFSGKPRRPPVPGQTVEDAPEIYNRDVILTRLYVTKERFFNKEEAYSLHTLNVISTF